MSTGEDSVAAGPVELPNAEATSALGRRLSGVLRAGDLVILSGGLGAGKTTLTQGIGGGLDIIGAVTSPTFVIARVHRSRSGGPDLVHVDAYRVGSRLEVDDLDLDASLPDSVTVVEWGAGKVEGLASDRLVVTLARAEGSTDDETRTVTVTGFGARWTGEGAADLATLLRPDAQP